MTEAVPRTRIEPQIPDATLECVEPPKAFPSDDRLESTRDRERAYAGSRGALEQRFYESLSRVPKPGMLELEASALVSHTGGKLSVVASRDEAGTYTIEVNGRGQVGLHAFAGAHLGAGVGAKYVVHTPEAAADLLQALSMRSLSLVAPPLEPMSLPKVWHYQDTALQQVALEGHASLGLRSELPVVLGAIELTGQAQAAIDFERHSVIVEQGVKEEGIARGGMLLTAAGLEGEVAVKLRTEIKAPREALERIRSGELSLVDAARAFEVSEKLILESEGRAEVATLFGGGTSSIQKSEVEVDLGKLSKDPTKLLAAMEGSIRTYTSSEPTSGTGLELPQVSVKLRSAIYDLHECKFSGEHSSPSLQHEVDVRRSTASH